MAENEVKECDYIDPYTEQTCCRSMHDGQYCIFHSKDIEGKKKDFEAAFWAEFERQKREEDRYDFSGFVFPDNISFWNEVFEKYVYFAYVQFNGEAGFEEAQFKNEANFWEAKFYRRASFYRCQIIGKADFGGAEFAQDAFFEKAKFNQAANFRRTQFFGYTQFNDITFEDPTLLNMIDTYFHDVHGLIENIERNRMKYKYPYMTEFLAKNVKPLLGEKTRFRYPIIARKIQDDIYLLAFRKRHPWLHFLWWLFADCGRSFSRWAAWSIVFMFAFAFIYYFGFYRDYPLNFQTVYISGQYPFLSFLYYSIVTFTTLGFGDIVPNTGWLQFWVAFEVILGYIMLGGLISILANKLARRS